jgi:histidinol-phosphate aminotransferase/threonine-phosphate decarboxylase
MDEWTDREDREKLENRRANLDAHGGLVHDELSAAGLRADQVLDLSVNVNPYGPCSIVRDAIAGAPLHRYPDPSAAPARQALASWMSIAPTRLVVGNGASELLWTLARAFLREGDVVAVVEPAFSVLRAAATRARARVVEHRTRPEDDFALDLRALDELLAKVTPRLLYLASPANPAGVCTPIEAIAELAARHRETLFIVDISFLSLSARHSEIHGDLSERIVWTRTLTKVNYMAGMTLDGLVALQQYTPPISPKRPRRPGSSSNRAESASSQTRPT